MNLTELSRKYWGDTIDMGNEFSIYPWNLIKVTNVWGDLVELDRHPNLIDMFKEDCRIEFAITVLEGRPVFQCDILYRIDGTQVKVIDLLKGVNGLITCKDVYESSIERHVEGNELTWTLPAKPVQFSKDETELLLHILAKSDYNYSFLYGREGMEILTNKLRNSITR